MHGWYCACVCFFLFGAEIPNKGIGQAAVIGDRNLKFMGWEGERNHAIREAEGGLFETEIPSFRNGPSAPPLWTVVLDEAGMKVGLLH